MTEKKRELTAEEFGRCTQILSAIQATCPHKRKTSHSQSFEGKHFTIEQCADCGMYNPGAFGFATAALNDPA